MRSHHLSRKGRIALVCISLIALFALIAVPLVHSAITLRTYEDVSEHNATPPTGWSGLGLPVNSGDYVVLRFETRNAAFDVRMRFGPELAWDRDSIYPYDVSNATSGEFKFSVPSDGSVEISWRPWASGKTVFIYQVRVVPNPTGLSLLPMFA